MSDRWTLFRVALMVGWGPLQRKMIRVALFGEQVEIATVFWMMLEATHPNFSEELREIERQLIEDHGISFRDIRP